ncbi:MAG: hypothetical protein WAW37_06790, partial [Syntrophobacteraceae bacterium]
MGGVIEKFLNIIPKTIDPQVKLSDSDFTRKRKLPFARLIVLILSLVASGKSKGVGIKSMEFFRSAARSGLWHDANAPHRGNVTRARKKVPWTVFQDILTRAVSLAYSLWPRDASYLWHNTELRPRLNYSNMQPTSQKGVAYAQENQSTKRGASVGNGSRK